MSYRLNGGPWTAIDLETGQSGSVNIAADGKPDLRFIAWVKVGQGRPQEGGQHDPLPHGQQEQQPRLPRLLRAGQRAVPAPAASSSPDELAEDAEADRRGEQGLVRLRPASPRRFGPRAASTSAIAEREVRRRGRIHRASRTRSSSTRTTGQPVRFWAVNGPPRDSDDRDALRRLARLLAKYGVNLVRIHGGYFDESGEVEPAEVQHSHRRRRGHEGRGDLHPLLDLLPALADAQAGHALAQGYDGKKHPFAALFFNKDFQKQYREWWKAAAADAQPDDRQAAGRRAGRLRRWRSSTRTPTSSGRSRRDNIPDPQLRILEGAVRRLARRRSTARSTQALAAWKGQKVARDNPAEGRIGFRPLWNMFNEKTARDKDTARFLAREPADVLRGDVPVPPRAWASRG